MSQDLRPSRRQALGLGLGALGVGAVAGRGVAAADPPPADGAAGAPGSAQGGDAATTASRIARLEVAAPTTPGTSYATYEGFAFQATGGVANVGNYGELLTASVSGYFTVHLDVPNGATITELVWYFDKFAASSMTCRLTRITTSNPSGGLANQSRTDVTNSSTVSAPVVAGTIQTLIQVPPTVSPGPALIDLTTSSYILIANMPASNTRLMGVRIGYTRPASPVSPANSFYPISPGRVYDSRWAVFGATKIAGGENRTISVKDRRRISPDDGVVDLVDFVPAAARAIAYNLTVTETVNAGFLAVTPGDATTFGASTINWASTGLNLANGTIVQLDSTRSIKVFAGGTTHFIIDVVGYFAP
jgi:hypothetical protein